MKITRLRLHGFNTPKYLQEVIVPAVETGAKKAGRSLDDIDIAGLGFIITGKDSDSTFIGERRSDAPICEDDEIARTRSASFL